MNRSRRLSNWFIVVLVALMPACGFLHDEEPHSVESAERIVPGETGKDALLGMFGLPDAILQPEDFQRCEAEGGPAEEVARYCAEGFLTFLASRPTADRRVWVYQGEANEEWIFAFPVDFYSKVDVNRLFVLIDSSTGLVSDYYSDSVQGEWR